MIEYVLAAIAGLAVGALAMRLRGQKDEADLERLRQEADQAVERARKETEAAARQEAEALREGARAEVEERRRALEKQEERVRRREEGAEGREAEVARQEGQLSRREKDLVRREKRLQHQEEELTSTVEEARKRIETAAALSREEARNLLADEVREDARRQSIEKVRAIEEEARRLAEERARMIVSAAIQRYASEHVAERTVTTVVLPSEELKGRIIGKEGRNIRAFEAATGCDLIVDDTPGAVIISGFNPVRREVAHLALTRLMADGRIHPTRIEELVRKAEKDVDKVCKEAGERAVFDLGLHRVHPELVKMLGRLKFRQSYAQNVLLHSIEVGYLAGLMAAELGANVKLARRAGLLHDIGKAVDHEQEGPHGEVGAAAARKYGESPKVCQAIAAHHGDAASPAPASVLDHLVASANALSAARPGARREQLASYVKRLEDLEAVCKRHGGVEKVFALQAGREVRVMVMNDQIDDAKALLLSRQIAHTLENEASYPGQIKVVVVRETRASDYAR